MAICVDCESEFAARRKELGYDRCLICAEVNPDPVPVFLIDVSKSNPMVTSRSEELVGRPGLTGHSSPTIRKYVRLSSQESVRDKS